MDKLRDIPCGINGLDDILGGFKTPSTILIAGTAGVGKTMMALQMLSNAAKRGEKTLYIPLTTESPEKLKMFLSTFEFFDESVQIHSINRPVAEKDPLTTLIDIGNVIDSVNPDRVVFDPITPLGFGFVEQEKRRFIYTFDSMVQEWDSLVVLTGEMLKDELHNSVISHLADGIIYMSREDMGYRIKHYLQILKMRGVNPKARSGYISRKYRCGMTPKGITVYPRPKPINDIHLSDTRIKSGIDGLDTMLNGGMMENSSMLVAGGPGTGKTIFGLQFINCGLLQKEPCIIATFDERPEQMVLEAKKLGLDLAPYIENGLLKFIYSDPDDVCPAEHAIRIKKCVESIGVKRVFFDGIVNLEMTLPDHLQLRGYLHSLTNYLKSSSVTSVFTTEISPNGKNRIISPDASFIMDSVIILKHIESENKLRKYAYILKSRGTKHDSKIREYSITDTGLFIKNDVVLDVK
ncbi:MAG TPA: circadian clock protein KaiC [Methanosarcinaceae archaeon]|nr:circadian clock protein KaiC [Methanosarcinaceae archaeon]